MKIRYFYNVDCYYLNQNAYFYYPLQRRLADYLHKIFPSGLNGIIESREVSKVGGRLIKKILDKIHAVLIETDWRQNLWDASYVIFDTETTGLQPFKGDKIISLAGVVIENGTIMQNQTFNTLVNPQRPISSESSRITGITDNMVAGMPTLHEVLPDFLDFIGNRILVAHCASFDLAFLNVELCRFAPVRIFNPVIDTYLISSIALPKMNNHSLESLINRFGLQMRERHTALGDSLMTAEIFLNLLEILTQKQIYTLDQLQRYLIEQRNCYFAQAYRKQIIE